MANVRKIIQSGINEDGEKRSEVKYRIELTEDEYSSLLDEILDIDFLQEPLFRLLEESR